MDLPMDHYAYRKLTLKVEKLTLTTDNSDVKIKGNVSLENVYIKNAEIDTIQVKGQITMVNGVSFVDDFCACGDKKPGFTWNGKTLCLDCIHGVVIHRESQKSWSDKFGDPLLMLKEEIANLKEIQIQMKNEISNMQKEILKISS